MSVNMTCRDSSNLLEARRRPVRSQIPLRYLVADKSEAGRRQVRSWSYGIWLRTGLRHWPASSRFKLCRHVMMSR